MRSDIWLLIGILIGVVLFPTLFYLYVLSGAAPVTVSASPLPMEHYLAKKAIHAKMDKEYPRNLPIVSDETSWTLGAAVYRDYCAVCHGIPDHSVSVIGSCMFPRAPQLFVKKEMVTDDPPGMTFWKAKNGIRLSGMPGFQGRLTDDQLWQVSLLLAAADELPAGVTRILLAEPNSSQSANQKGKPSSTLPK
jgi:thiosulfate dehydrogenase